MNGFTVHALQHSTAGSCVLHATATLMVSLLLVDIPLLAVLRATTSPCEVLEGF